ncbi:hypothetical protein QZH41_020505, partial [Actinostola sp. cb2023]
NPCAFALNMTLTKENLLENIKTSHACIKPDHGAKPDEESITHIDTDRYPMKHLVLRDIVDDPSAPAPKLLNTLAKHLDQSALQTRCFLVDVSDTTIDEDAVAQ